MSNIRQIGPNLWTAHELMGVTPQFMRTEHATKRYPNGASLIHEPLFSYKPVPIKYTIEGAEDMGEVFE